MQKFNTLKSVPAYLPIVNIDTDMIIPKQFLKTIKRTGLGKNLFFEMRYDDQGKEISDFVLNQNPYNGSKILIAGKNFGCGSSREHAPWALLDFGITCVISSSYADIFYSNCFKNGILPIILEEEKIKELYETAERNTRLRKKTVTAIELFSQFIEERKNTGRVYLMNVDHANTHGAFDEQAAPIKQSNLCCEINLPTKPLKHVFDEEGEISLCTLAAINWGNIRTPKDFERVCRLSVRALDELLTYQDYPVSAAERSTKNRRPLGVGIINFAYWLAKNDLNYQDINEDGLALVDEWAEAWSYYLIKASADLAEEKGAIPKNNETKYSLGITPNQTYKKDVDELVPHTEDKTGKNYANNLKQQVFVIQL